MLDSLLFGERERPVYKSWDDWNDCGILCQEVREIITMLLEQDTDRRLDRRLDIVWNFVLRYTCWLGEALRKH
jgi:hypothetical protein